MAEETEFAMGATASCVDGPGGKVSRVIIDPATETVTHLVIEPKHRLGNISDVHMLELVSSPQQLAFGLAKRDTLPKYCRDCEVRFACHGECPKNRFIETPDGEAGLNYLCAGYKTFFTHIDRPMKMMADLLKRGRYADEVMALLH